MKDLTFDDCVGHVFDVEKGFSIVRTDRGNWTGGEIGVGELWGTNHGISAPFFAENYPNLRPKDLTKEQARGMLKKHFWDANKCDSIPNIVRLHFFDVAVNSGGKRAVILLQRSIGSHDDGKIGDQTRGNFKYANIPAFEMARSDYYVDIVRKDVSQLVNLKGWLRRIFIISNATDKLLSL